MLATLPHIPDNAPFTPSQRAWLNGYLAGLFSKVPQPQSAPTQPATIRVGIYFATQSGTSERLAKKLAKALKVQGHTVEVASLEKATSTQIASQHHALFLASTYGEGDPPDGVRTFRDEIFADKAPALKSLRYSVFCLGDRNYEHFCKFGIDLDERLQQLGATRILPRVESDVEVDVPFDDWQKTLLPQLTSQSASMPVPTPVVASASVISEPKAEQTHTRDNPYHAPIVDRFSLTSDVSSKLTMHLSVGLEDAPIDYHAGDACGVVAQNDPALVGDILARVPFTPTSMVALPRLGACSIEEALLHHLQPTRLSRKIVSSFAEKSHSKTLQTLLSPEQGAHLESFMHGRGLIDLLEQYPGVITTPEELVAMLPRLTPRLYSISSSPAAHGRELHCTIAVVRYRSHNRERGGIASTMLADRVSVGDRIPIYIQPNKRFRIPVDGDTPMIMVGPGTGIAPFRAFLHERQALGHTGSNWLFFGERSAKTDFLYCRELRAMCESGHLTRLDTAFSRDQSHKVYVQDRMLEHGAELWRWLEQGAQFYVCGDASRMAKDVDSALHRVVETHGSMSPDAAAEYISHMQDQHRYHRDVY